MSIEDFFGYVCVALAAIFVVVIVWITAIAPHNVDYYYVHEDCVWEHWTWHIDEKAYCPADKNTLPEVVKKFNDSMGKEK
jgi:hypothetical protein